MTNYSSYLVAAGFSLRFFEKTQAKACGYQERFFEKCRLKSAATNAAIAFTANKFMSTIIYGTR